VVAWYQAIARSGGYAVLIDCDTCLARGISCGDCVISVLLATPGKPTELDDAERAALGSLAAVGLVPPLRLLSTAADGPQGSARHRRA
jgi:hypothetical protein